jgi:hypothetical protein
MDNTRTLKQIIAGAMLSGGIALSGFGLATGTAHADGPHHWCPGNPKTMPYVPNDMLDWDWTVCHTWYPTNYGWGNVTIKGRPTSIWDGDNPPPAATEPRVCPPISFMCP